MGPRFRRRSMSKSAVHTNNFRHSGLDFGNDVLFKYSASAKSQEDDWSLFGGCFISVDKDCAMTRSTFSSVSYFRPTRDFYEQKILRRV